jgi:hypothetical protein
MHPFFLDRFALGNITDKENIVPTDGASGFHREQDTERVKS